MRYLLAAALVLCTALPCLAGESKAERIRMVKEKIRKAEKCINENNPEQIEWFRKQSPAVAKDIELAVRSAQERLPVLRIQLRWLLGELTAESAQKAVTAAEKDVSDAKDDAAKAQAQAVLDAARAELDAVRGFEAAELAKAGKGEF